MPKIMKSSWNSRPCSGGKGRQAYAGPEKDVLWWSWACLFFTGILSHATQHIAFGLEEPCGGEDTDKAKELSPVKYPSTLDSCWEPAL